MRWVGSDGFAGKSAGRRFGIQMEGWQFDYF
jgi:hypothetical protein